MYKQCIDQVPLRQRLFANWNPVRPGGPMQVGIAFARAHAKARAHLPSAVQCTMNLSTFITKNIEPILVEWERFALTVFPEGQRTDSATLRDHGKKMLLAIALDLSEPETAKQQSKKSKGAVPDQQQPSAAKIHGSSRLALGLTLNAAVAEYRALRASVIRLWQEAIEDSPSVNKSFEDLIRFNEAIDQAITESVASYSLEKDQQTRLFDAILSTSLDLSFTFNPAGRLAYANRAFLAFLGLPWEAVQDKKWMDLVEAGGAELQGCVRAVIQGKDPLHGEIELASHAGAATTFDWILVPVMTADRQLESVAGTMRDITSRKISDDKNRQKANYDELTGLPNRSLFLDRLDQAVLHAGSTGTATALLFIDLDRFKEVNDGLGHGVGDLLLKLVAGRLRACVRVADTVARLGGDEFTVVLRDVTNAEHVGTVAEKIVKELALPFQIGENSVHVSASVGICLSPQDMATSKSLMNAADLAMYAAKSKGRNRFVFFSSGLLGQPGESNFGRL